MKAPINKEIAQLVINNFGINDRSEERRVGKEC